MYMDQDGGINFNPRSYKRSDMVVWREYGWVTVISIHAPTRGATCSVMRKCSAPCYFNPRSYKRSDEEDTIMANIYALFQSTLLQEERRRWCGQKFDWSDISIHAPTRGATSCYLLHSWQLGIFQSTLLQEERQQSA